MIGLIRNVLTKDGRVAARREIRKQLAMTELAQRRLEEITAEVAELNRLADEAADQHTATCEPLQSELEQVEARILSRLADREPADPSDDARRAELLDLIAQANDSLEATLSTLKKRRAKLDAEQREKGLGRISGTRQSLQSQLCHPGIADPELVAQLHAAKDAAEWASRRYREAKKNLQLAQTDVGLARDSHAQGRCDRHVIARAEEVLAQRRAIEDHANKQVRIAETEVARIRQAMQDE